MNFNANAAGRPPFARKVKRVSDVNSMGYNPYNQQPYMNNPIDNSNSQQFPPDNMAPNIPQQPQLQPKQPFDTTKDMGYGYNQNPSLNIPPQMQPAPGLGVFAQPMVQDMAYQYGQQLANTGKTMVQQEIQKYVPLIKLKYYFAVDTKYVISKLGLLLFPFTHSDWSIKYAQDGPVQPRYEINAPDLYIPTMAYVTFVLVAGLVLGMQKRFSPEQISIQASSALAWCVFELAIYSCTMYISNIKASLRTLDLLAYSGYKFVGIIVSVLISMLAEKMGYYSSLIYLNLALAFFLVRSLKGQILPEQQPQAATSYYGEVQVQQTGNKRRLYFLLFVALTQPVLSWWLSFHLIGYTLPTPTSR
nr:protein YIF1B [Onthophagus taurus]